MLLSKSRAIDNYHVPTLPDLPDIDVPWTDTPNQDPMGARVVGEICSTGVRIGDLAITVEGVGHLNGV